VKTDRPYLEHIADAIRAIETYTAGDSEAFMADRKTQDAVLRNLEVIGEAVKRLSPRTLASDATIPWRSIAGMRDKLIHAYFGVDLALVWRVVESDLPPLAAAVGRLLAGGNRAD
jgi:uncharacterized protein with HEPN domain